MNRGGLVARVARVLIPVAFSVMSAGCVSSYTIIDFSTLKEYPNLSESRDVGVIIDNLNSKEKHGSAAQIAYQTGRRDVCKKSMMLLLEDVKDSADIDSALKSLDYLEGKKW